MLKAACNFIKTETLEQVFSCEICEIFENIFFTEHHRWMLLDQMSFKDSITSANAVRCVKHLCLATYVYLSNYQIEKETSYSDLLGTVLVTKVEQAGRPCGIS